MSNHDDTLVDAVVGELAKYAAMVEMGRSSRPPVGNAEKIIAAVRRHDAGLPCGHCTPGDDEIRCACEIGGEDE